jgi:hypothetical protein
MDKEGDGDNTELSWKNLVAGGAAGIIAHEVVGIGYMFGAWALCYRFGATARIVPYLPVSARNVMERWTAVGHAKTGILIKRYPKLLVLNPQQVLVSGAESFAIRKLLTPISVPAKLYLAFYVSNLVASSKSIKETSSVSSERS